MNNQELLQQYAGQAMMGMLSSPTMSSMAMNLGSEVYEKTGSTSCVPDVVARISWNIAEAMLTEGKERGHITSES